MQSSFYLRMAMPSGLDMSTLYLSLTFHSQQEKNKIMWFNLTRILSFPWKMEATISINLLRWWEHCRSHTEPVTLSPLLFHSCKHLSISSWFREQIWTAAQILPILQQWHAQFKMKNKNDELINDVIEWKQIKPCTN